MDRKMTVWWFSFLLLAGVSFIPVESCGEERTHKASLSVEAKTTQDRENKQSVEEKENASVATIIDTETETCTLEIEVENRSEQSDTYTVQWFFISKKSIGKGDESLVVFSPGKAQMIIDGGSSDKKTIESAPFIYTIKTIDRAGRSYSGSTATQTRGGNSYAGYIVLVKAGGEVLQQKSNSSRFLTDEWIAKCETASSGKDGGAKKKKQ